MLVFGSEPWAGNFLLTWERVIPRKMFGPTNENCIWRIRIKHELQKMYKYIGIITDIKIKRLDRGRLTFNDDRISNIDD